ncbi:MAG: 2-oxo acid dehydrogenase subunit E2 [Microbacteriaceae bacterium]|nr:MAG: 2-oxo acid dehydrogenase subunit E2 [Microbacteriaceae bacterium]
MTTRVFTLPDLGEGLSEAELVRWLVAVGDTIAVDQPIAEVETAKSVVEVPSPFAGVVETLHGTEGEALTVGEPLVSVAEEPVAEAAEVPVAAVGVDADAHDGDFETAAGGLPNQQAEGSGNVLVGYGTTETAHSARRRRRVANAGGPRWSSSEAYRDQEIRDQEISGTGLDTLVPRYSTNDGNTLVPRDPSRRPQAASSGRGSTTGDDTDARRTGPIAVSSPVVRQLARVRGVDLATVHPSGPAGVITRHDVEAAPVEQASAGTLTGTTAPVPDTPADVDSRTGLTIRTTTQLSLFRRTVAANMTRSRSEIPEATVWVDVDATELRELRRRIRIGERHPSIVALIARFTLTALARYPMLAARLSPDAASLIEFDGVNLGVAADTPRGLVVPVIRAANTLSLRELDAELARLTSAARYGTASAAELTGSTFTINNYGTLGVDGSAAIINHPEVAILGIGRMLERPWIIDGQILPRTIVQLSLVFDHRVCDGGTAAGFLRMIADAVEHPYDAFADL